MLGSFTSAQLLAALTDETGTGVAVFATSPTITTPTIATINGVASTNILLDSDADIVLDADGADIILKDGGTTFAALTQSGGELLIKSGATPTTAVTFSGANATVAGTLASGALNVGSATGATTGQIKASGDIIAFASSDATLKTDVAVITDALAKVNSLRGVTYTWNEEANTLGLHGTDTGVIAQEVARVLPEVVTTRDSGHMAVKYDKMIGLLIEAIKELDIKVSKCTCTK